MPAVFSPGNRDKVLLVEGGGGKTDSEREGGARERLQQQTSRTRLQPKGISHTIRQIPLATHLPPTKFLL
jgi:hypothetical protein